MKDYRIRTAEYLLASILICVLMVTACLVAVYADEQPVAVIYSDIYQLNQAETEVGIAPGEDSEKPEAFPPGEERPYYADLLPDTRPEAQYAGVRLDGGFMYLPEIPLTFGEQLTIFRITNEAGIPWHVALGIIDKETNGTFNKTAVNHHTHDYGLWQINKKSWFRTARQMYGISSMDELLDVELNTRMGIYVLTDCINHYGLTEKAYVAYNAGRAYTASNKYSRDVASRAAKWQGVMEEYDKKHAED